MWKYADTGFSSAVTKSRAREARQINRPIWARLARTHPAPPPLQQSHRRQAQGRQRQQIAIEDAQASMR